MKIRIRKKNFINNHIGFHILGLSLLIRVMIDFINCVELKLSFKPNGSTIITGFMILLVWYTILRYKLLSMKGLAIYFGFFLTLLINCLFFGYMEYFETYAIKMIFILYIPLAIFIISRIENWEYGIDILSKYCFVGILLDMIGMIFLDFINLCMYMSYSFGLLPLLIISYIYFRTKQNIGRYLYIILFVAGTISLVFLSCRSVIIFLFLYLVIYEIINTHKTIQYLKKSLLLILPLILLILADINSKIILEKLYFITKSRTLQYMLSMKLFDADGRDDIFIVLIDAIKSMGLKSYGIFGDRYLLKGLFGTGSLYAHNIILEVIVNLGIIVGPLVLIILFYNICKAFFKADYNKRNLVAAFTVSLFLRYFVSGSYIIEGNFYIFIAILVSVLRSIKNKTTQRGLYHE